VLDNQKIQQLISAYLALNDTTFSNPSAAALVEEALTLIREAPQDDEMALATIRYLFVKKAWDLSGRYPSKELWSEVLNRFFGPGNKVPANYLESTKTNILNWWGFDVPDPVVNTQEEKPKAKGKATKKTTKRSKPANDEEGESGSRTFKALKDN
jgi:hypothetical protein